MTGPSKSLAEVRLEPVGRRLRVTPGTSLNDLLFDEGVEFPCGGRGRCGGCRVRVKRGEVAVSPADRRLFTAEELVQGWRLACCARISGDVALDLVQWEAPVLVDHSRVPFEPREGLGVVVDLGTTTLAAQLLELPTGRVLSVQTGLNRQGRHGADLMSRLDFAVNGGGREILKRQIRGQVGKLVFDLARKSRHELHELRDIVLVGNTVMHHLFCDEDVGSLAVYPFDSDRPGLRVFSGGELEWAGLRNVRVRFLPGFGGFVGSDVLAGVLATGLGERQGLCALVDLGTNGEIVVGNGDRLLCASTAAGPAFEGARISCGMRAASGAIASVQIEQERLVSRVLGGGPGRGVCGSGLVDAVACGLQLGWVGSNGRLTSGDGLFLAPSVSLRQTDIRELQLAKGAIAAGLRLLVGRFGATVGDLERVYLAGAFGNYIHRKSAARIGLFATPLDRVTPAGNTALRGAKLALFRLPKAGADYAALRARTQHVCLHEDPQFQEAYVAEMRFPEEKTGDWRPGEAKIGSEGETGNEGQFAACSEQL